ncbi:gamma-glutamylcyclotransferase [Dehalococcoidales bacterium]|nr:gamma-glutamylcyclotransferase [Dehalococcoidales bacterium]
MGSKWLYYFAYGSNLNLTRMKNRCPHSRPLFKACLHDYELIFGINNYGKSIKIESGAATIRQSKGKKVFGAVYKISEGNLRSLDGYEGYPSLYGRITVEVFTKKGNPWKTITYIMEEPIEEIEPTPQYLSVIKQGYGDWRIPIDVLRCSLRKWRKEKKVLESS